MLTPLIVCPLLVVAILLLSGVAKIGERQATADAFLSLRIPAVASRLGGPLVLPWAEIALAVLLLVSGGPVRIAVSVLSLAVFVSYLAVIARALTFDEPVTCSCFGSLGLGTVSVRTVWRNAAIVVVSAVAVVQAVLDDRPLAAAMVTGSTWLWLVMLAATAVLVWLIVGGSGDREAQEVARPAAEYERALIPYLRLDQPDGSPVQLRALAARRAQMMVVLSLSCGPCLRVRDALPAFAEANPEVDVRIVLLRPPAAGEIPTGIPYVLDADNQFATTFELRTPGAVLLGTDGLLAGGPTSGESAVLGFLAELSSVLAEGRLATEG